mgnify:FL=1
MKWPFQILIAAAFLLAPLGVMAAHIYPTPGEKVISFRGDDRGCAAEIYNLYLKSGLYPGMNQLKMAGGPYVIVFEHEDSPPPYGVNFVIRPPSKAKSKTDGQTVDVSLSGPVADELLEVMVAAGIPQQHSGSNTIWHGKHFACFRSSTGSLHCEVEGP